MGNEKYINDKELSETEKNLYYAKIELDEKYYCLGRKLHEIADKEIYEINKLVDRIVELKLEIDENTKKVICRRCNSENLWFHDYCYNCGEKLIYKGDV